MMTLEDQAAPLAQAQEMKALGFPQETEYSYFERDEAFALAHSVETQFDWEKRCAAPTVAEMGEWMTRRDLLPDTAPRWELTMWRDRNGNWWHDRHPGCDEIACSGHATEAEARARLLIALANAGVLDPKRIA